jgi:hypothetical protein
MEEALARVQRNQPQSERNQDNRDNQNPGERSARQNPDNSGQPQAGSQRDSQQNAESGQQSANNQQSNPQNANNGQQQAGSESMQDQRRGNSARGGDRNAFREMQGLVDRYNQLLERMEREYAEDPGMRHTVESARHSAVPRITGELLSQDEASDRFRESIFTALSQIETQLLKQLNASEQEKLYSSGKPEVPGEYRTMVEKYFESLSKRAR